MKKDDNRLLKNFSDFWTYFLAENIPDENKVICGFSRSIWDPNRDLDNTGLFRNWDFNNVPIWKIKIPNFIKKYLIRKFYDKYHLEIKQKLNVLEKKYWNVIHLDIHDTWNLLMWKEILQDKLKKDYFPEVNVLSVENKSCDLKVTKKIAKLFEKEFLYKTNIDNPFGGWWFVTRKYWFDNKNVNWVRIELWRYIFLNEKTQEIDLNKMNDIKNKFERVLKQL
jgi:N-formylglutamate amidohydrolase